MEKVIPYFKALSRRSATIEVGNWALNIEKYNLLNVKLMSICMYIFNFGPWDLCCKKKQDFVIIFLSF